jgi:geranylgeranyl reductase family protein
MKMEHKFDVLIVGAGPAGTTAALGLEKSGLRVALVDKDVFPRDKICGDFVAIQGLRETFDLVPSFKEYFANYPKKALNTSTSLYVDKFSPFRVEWVTRSYVIKRMDFDNELLNQVKKGGVTYVFEGEGIKRIERLEEGGFAATTAKGTTLKAKLIIGADGAHSVVAKQLAGYKVDREHYGGSVRAYFTGVENIDSAVNELHIQKEVVPGYFWLFPVSETEANVGLGMHSRYITKNKVDLKKLFDTFIENNPALRSKLGNATQVGKLEGFGLPFFSKAFPLAGEGFMLCGDAGSMVDPSSGEGIYPAIYSGKMAARIAIEAFEEQDFSATKMGAYEDLIHKKFWKNMKTKAWLAKHFAHRYGLIKSVGYLCAEVPFIRKRLQKLL